MVSVKSVEEQLKKIRFMPGTWNKPEIAELPHILFPDEEIFECVNGFYENGTALLCATNFRLLLIDKKPLRYLTVEDVRFDTINQIDYSHRLFDANISVCAGVKTLAFRSYNQPRLRKLIGHVQSRMADIKSQQSLSTNLQQLHLKQINEQLQAYLLAQYKQQRSFIEGTGTINNETSRGLEAKSERTEALPEFASKETVISSSAPEQTDEGESASSDDLYNEGYKEIFGKVHIQPASSGPSEPSNHFQSAIDNDPIIRTIVMSKISSIVSKRRSGAQEVTPKYV